MAIPPAESDASVRCGGVQSWQSRQRAVAAQLPACLQRVGRDPGHAWTRPAPTCQAGFGSNLAGERGREPQTSKERAEPPTARRRNGRPMDLYGSTRRTTLGVPFIVEGGTRKDGASGQCELHAPSGGVGAGVWRTCCGNATRVETISRRSRALPGGRLATTHWNRGSKGRLLKRKARAAARKEGSRRGTRGSPALNDETAGGAAVSYEGDGEVGREVYRLPRALLVPSFGGNGRGGRGRPFPFATASDPRRSRRRCRCSRTSPGSPAAGPALAPTFRREATAAMHPSRDSRPRCARRSRRPLHRYS